MRAHYALAFALWIGFGAASAAAAAAPSVTDFSVFACNAYVACSKLHALPAGWTRIDWQPSAPHTAFQAAAFYNQATSALVVSYAGTKFEDAPDVAADRALVKLATLGGALSRGHAWHKGRDEVAKQAWVPDQKSERYTYQVLAAKLHEAELFLKLAQTDAQKLASGKTLTTYVTGHSLGGMIAQVMAHDHGLAAHTFNSAPAARIVIGKSGPATIVNHRRKGDAVSMLIKTHHGRVCNYSDSGSKNPAELHRISVFVEALLHGLKSSDCN